MSIEKHEIKNEKAKTQEDVIKEIRESIAELQQREKARDKNFKPKHDFNQA